MTPQDFRKLLAGFPAPVTVVTAQIDGKPFGATVSSFASLSLDPPLISFALMNGAALLEVVRQAGACAINLLSHHQADIAMTFASKVEDRFSNLSWVWEHGQPRIIGASSFMVCDLREEIEGGDHALLFGHVRAGVSGNLPPLVYTARVFGTHSKLAFDQAPTLADAIAACAS